MSRLEKLTREQMTDAQREAFDEIVESRSRVPQQGARKGVYEPLQPSNTGRLGGPFEPWLRSPDVARRLVALGGALRFQTSLDARSTELAILVTARAWTAQYEWFAHARFAERAGISTEVIDAIRERKPPTLESARDRAVYAFATELHRDRKVSDATYATAVESLGETGVVDLVALLGFYTAVSMTLNSFEVEVPGGADPLEA